MIAAESGTVTLVLKQKKTSESHRNIGFYVFKTKEGKKEIFHLPFMLIHIGM